MLASAPSSAFLKVKIRLLNGTVCGLGCCFFFCFRQSNVLEDIPKRFRPIIQRLSTESQFRLVCEELDRAIHADSIPLTFTSEQVDAEGFDIAADLSHYSSLSSEQILMQLTGQNVPTIPGLAEWEDTSGAYTLWDQCDAAKKLFDTSKESHLRKRLALNRHQLVGIHKICGHALRREGVLLMDAVGVGKTAQAIGSVVMRNWMLEYFAQHQKFPGAFGRCLHVLEQPGLLLIAVLVV